MVASPTTSACSPVRSTLQAPYRLDDTSYSAVELGEEAVMRCRADGRAVAALPPIPFSTDGCTLVPNGRSAGCCVEHDMAYWCGGAPELRAAADVRLRLCVRAHSGPLAATAAYLAVRVGGSRWLPVPWRWGYGFPWLHEPGRAARPEPATGAASAGAAPSTR